MTVVTGKCKSKESYVGSGCLLRATNYWRVREKTEHAIK